ncbi:MAG: DNA methylase [Bacteroidaceae bacterium]|nr:DNA methylase [Bacteroidaceae bacterium]
MDLSKYFTGEVVTVNRSAVHFATYNPREISEEERRNIKRGIKRYGLLGGIVLNKQTGLTIVQGHQRISVMDELEKYNPQTKENDYAIRAELIDVDLKTEMTINVLLNNPNAQGKWNRDKLAELVPQIEYKDAGLTDADLSLMGLDYLFKTEDEENLANSLGDLMAEVYEENEAEKVQRQAERAAKVAHMKDVKEQVRQNAQKSAGDMDAYVMLSFDNIDNKNQFLQRFGYDADSKFINGEDFDSRCEVIDTGEE